MIRSLYLTLLLLALLGSGLLSCSPSDKTAEKPTEPLQTTPPSVTEKPSLNPVLPSTSNSYAKIQPVDPPPGALKKPFKEPISPILYELPSGAVATWREVAAFRPTLLLFSTHPLLQPVPETMAGDVEKLLKSGTPAEIIRRGTADVPDPAFLSTQALSVAIEGGFFSNIVIVFPINQPINEASLEDFRQRVVPARFLTKEEADKLTVRNGVIAGTVRNVPLQIVHSTALPTITTPVAIHVDLSYFKGLFVNDIKTPIYNLLYQTASQIRDAKYKIVAFTLSYSNQEVNFSLESRFIISDFAAMLRDPKRLEGKTPASWSYRAKTFQLRAMYLETDAKAQIKNAAASNPSDPAALYSLALLLFQENHPDEGFKTLDRAVALDKGYALAYLELADRGVELGDTKTVITLLEKATRALPNYPNARILLAEKLLQVGRERDAERLLADLRQLPWSSTFHPEIPQRLAQIARKAEDLPAPVKP